MGVAGWYRQSGPVAQTLAIPFGAVGVVLVCDARPGVGQSSFKMETKDYRQKNKGRSQLV